MSSQIVIRRIALLSFVACALYSSGASAQSSPAFQPHAYSLLSSTLRLAPGPLAPESALDLQVRPLEEAPLPSRRYAGPLVFMGLGFGAAVAGGVMYAFSDFHLDLCFSEPCESTPAPPKDPAFLVPIVLGVALMAAGTGWLITRVTRYRYARTVQRSGYQAW